MASIVQRGNSYCVVYQYTNEEGKRKQKWKNYKTSADAKRRKKEIEYKEEMGTFTVPKCRITKDLLKTLKTASSVRKIFLPRTVAEMLIKWKAD